MDDSLNNFSHPSVYLTNMHYWQLLGLLSSTLPSSLQTNMSRTTTHADYDWAKKKKKKTWNCLYFHSWILSPLTSLMWQLLTGLAFKVAWSASFQGTTVLSFPSKGSSGKSSSSSPANKESKISAQPNCTPQKEKD